jgi:hypothetical protein
MMDHEKLQKGRAWVYGIGAVVVALAVLWKFAIR